MKEDIKELDNQEKFKVYRSISDLNDTQQLLVKTAMEHTEFSYSPYSNFSVGAGILLINGEIMGGSNQENASYPLCLCAERTALAAAASIHPGVAVKSVAVTAYAKNDFVESPVSPCGACRQVISEYSHRFKSDIEIILYSKSQIIVFQSIDELLPLSFNFDSLP